MVWYYTIHNCTKNSSIITQWLGTAAKPAVMDRIATFFGWVHTDVITALIGERLCRFIDSRWVHDDDYINTVRVNTDIIHTTYHWIDYVHGAVTEASPIQLHASTGRIVDDGIMWK
jgi:hypothetical protein